MQNHFDNRESCRTRMICYIHLILSIETPYSDSSMDRYLSIMWALAYILDIMTAHLGGKTAPHPYELGAFNRHIFDYLETNDISGFTWFGAGLHNYMLHWVFLLDHLTNSADITCRKTLSCWFRAFSLCGYVAVFFFFFS